MAREVKRDGIVAQVERLVRDRAHLRTVIESMLSIARNQAGIVKPAVADELQKALDYTADTND